MRARWSSWGFSASHAADYRAGCRLTGTPSNVNRYKHRTSKETFQSNFAPITTADLSSRPRFGQGSICARTYFMAWFGKATATPSPTRLRRQTSERGTSSVSAVAPPSVSRPRGIPSRAIPPLPSRATLFCRLDAEAEPAPNEWQFTPGCQLKISINTGGHTQLRSTCIRHK